MSAELLRVEDLRVTFETAGSGRASGHEVQAVAGIDLAVAAGETLGLVGESGCGKSSAGLAILRLIPAEGSVRFEGDETLGASASELRRLRRRMQIIFQDPFSSLNPRHTIGQILREPLEVHGIGRRPERDRLVEAMLERVGLDAGTMRRYPHEFSGGQRQRIGIARALMLEPSFVVCDEPTSALDVSTQAQIIDLLQSLQKSLGIAYLFIAHDLAVVRHISHRIAVMYLGRIVEIGDSDTLCESPRHPYTRALIDAAPVPDPAVEAIREHRVLEGDLPDAANPPSGCRFRTRCPFATERCGEEEPPLRPYGDDRRVACHHAERIATESEALSL